MAETEEVFQEPFPVDLERYREYMLSQDETGELAESIKKLRDKPVRVNLDEL